MEEIRTINRMRVRETCIKYNYYTRGSNEDYNNLLFNLCKRGNITLEDLKEIATDILEHSTWEEQAEFWEEQPKPYGYGYNELLCSIIAVLINECCRSFIAP